MVALMLFFSVSAEKAETRYLEMVDADRTKAEAMAAEMIAADPTNGGSTPSYQWKKNGNPVGANSSTYSDATLANGDQIRVGMTSSGPCAMPPTATSNKITMTVTAANSTFITGEVAASCNDNGTVSVFFSPNVMSAAVRYVRIQQNIGDYLNLSEVRVIEAYSGNNVALNKPVTSQSIYSPAYPDANLVDGNTSSFMNSGAPGTNQFVEIDLGGNYLLSHIEVVNRPDDGQSRARDLQLSLKDAAQNVIHTQRINAYQGQNTGYATTWGTANLSSSLAPLSAVRYIRVKQNANDYMNLAELRAIEAFTGENVALFKTLTAQSIFGVGVQSLTNAGLVDGDINSFTASGTSGTDEYFEIDLGATYLLDRIEIVNRGDCCQSRAQNLQLMFKDGNGNVVYSQQIDAYEGQNSAHTTTWNVVDVSWMDGATTLHRSGLPVGAYTISYADVNGLSDSKAFEVNAGIPVIPTVSITAAPGNSITAGDPVTFTAAPVNGGAAPFYQWKKNGNNVGANGFTYTDSALINGDEITVELTSSIPCAQAPAAVSNSIVMTVADRTLYVNRDLATGNNNGSSWENAFRGDNALHSAFAAATIAGTKIWVAAGAYKPTTSNNRNLYFLMPNGVSLYGGFAGDESSIGERNIASNPTILSGEIGDSGIKSDNSYHLIFVNNLAQGVVIDGFIIENAYNEWGGAAILSHGSQVAISNCTFRENTGYVGGGLNFSGGQVTLEKCRFHNNQGFAGGGAIASGAGTLIANNCLFYNNSANDSGAAFFSQSAPELAFTNCLFYGNQVSNYDGSAIYIADGAITLDHCTVAGNNNRRALAILGAMGTVKNSIVWANPWGGGGGSNVTSINCILQENATAGSGNIYTNPQFVNFNDPDGDDDIFGTADDGFVPGVCSPAIDGAAAPSPAFDLAGLNRVDAPVIGVSAADIGAYEQQEANYPAVLADISLENVSPLSGNGTICTEDDFFTADVIVAFTNISSIGILNINAPQILTPVAPVAMSATTTATTHTFVGVVFKPVGQINLTAAISDMPCTYSESFSNMPYPALGQIECTECGTKWYDLGGAANPYPAYQTQSKTFCPPTTDHKAQLDFLTVEMAGSGDVIYIYDGPNGTGAFLGTLSAGSSLTTFTATASNSTGCLSAFFYAFSGQGAAGWEADFNCVRIYDITADNISGCDGANTTCMEDDTYTADITVHFAGVPSTGMLTLTGAGIIGSLPGVPVGDLSGNSYTFIGVLMVADGDYISLTAGFSAEGGYTDHRVDRAPGCGAVTTNIVVDGFIAPSDNGTYMLDGTRNNAPRWSNGSVELVYLGGYWGFVRLGQSPYTLATLFTSTNSFVPCNGWYGGFGFGLPNLSGACGITPSSVPVSAGPSCAITNISLANAGACNDNGTITQTDDYFTANVTITFAYAPVGATLTLKQGSNVLASTQTDLTCTTTYTFENVQIPSNGAAVILTAEFSPNCTFTSGVLMTAPQPCSCQPTSAFTNCPVALPLNVAPGTCSAIATYSPTANGNPAPVYTYSFSGATTGSGNGTGSGSTFAVGTTTVTITAVNDCGTAVCTFNVTVTDNILPTIECFNQALAFNGEASFSLYPDELADASDNCAIQGITLSPNIIYAEQLGQIVPVVATATDVNGNVSTCTSHITVTGLPAGWNQTPGGIGCSSSCTDFSYNTSTGVWTGASTGAFYGPPFTGDAAAFAQRTLCGAGSITVQVTSINGGGWAGIVMRESNAAGAKKAQLLTNLGSQNRREFRTETNGAASPQQFTSLNRYWLRIVRTGNQFTLFTSSNGSTWYPSGTQTIVMGNCIQMGLVITNNTANSTVTATFASVSYAGSNSGLGGSIGRAGRGESIEAPHSFEIFPNPTGGELNVDLTQYIGRNVRMEFYSIEGKLLQFREIDEVQATLENLDLSLYANGMYFIKVQSRDLPAVTKRVVLQRE
ncbi:MAG: discoidin domain-containing protein [Saprospiraceae bacterium]|nr:discoidin domain-containing protein [Saprospiraceae bacterium]